MAVAIFKSTLKAFDNPIAPSIHSRILSAGTPKLTANASISRTVSSPYAVMACKFEARAWRDSAASFACAPVARMAAARLASAPSCRAYAEIEEFMRDGICASLFPIPAPIFRVSPDLIWLNVVCIRRWKSFISI